MRHLAANFSKKFRGKIFDEPLLLATQESTLTTSNKCFPNQSSGVLGGASYQDMDQKQV
jgi:hypothetical protein